MEANSMSLWIVLYSTSLAPNTKFVEIVWREGKEKDVKDNHRNSKTAALSPTPWHGEAVWFFMCQLDS